MCSLVVHQRGCCITAVVVVEQTFIQIIFMRTFLENSQLPRPMKAIHWFGPGGGRTRVHAFVGVVCMI